MRQRYKIQHLLHPIRLLPIAMAYVVLCLIGCVRQPPLHLHEDGGIEIKVPLVKVEFDVYWDYYFENETQYDWRSEWFYGWDDEDKRIFGELGYREPTVFQLRRYYTKNTPGGEHQQPFADIIYDHSHQADYNWGFWDILVWNEIYTEDGVQSINFDETTTFEYVLAYTNETMNVSHYDPSRSRSFYQPEQLFCAYEPAIEINKDLDGFYYDPVDEKWVKSVNLMLEPVTYIYLPQIILRHNNGKIANVDGSGNLSGMARMVQLNTGITGSEPVTIYHNLRLKKHCEMEGEDVDIIGGRLLTFGMCNMNPNRVGRAGEHFVGRVDDGNRHLLDVTLQFNNGYDSTFVFDVTDKVQRFYKGGVLSVELDCDTVKIPSRSGGSGFNATVEDVQDGGIHEIEM